MVKVPNRPPTPAEPRSSGKQPQPEVRPSLTVEVALVAGSSVHDRDPVSAQVRGEQVRLLCRGQVVGEEPVPAAVRDPDESSVGPDAARGEVALVEFETRDPRHARRSSGRKRGWRRRLPRRSWQSTGSRRWTTCRISRRCGWPGCYRACGVLVGLRRRILLARVPEAREAHTDSGQSVRSRSGSGVWPEASCLLPRASVSVKRNSTILRYVRVTTSIA